MAKLILLRGVPASGKSTWRNLYVSLHPGTVVASRDDIRMALYGIYWGDTINEKIISDVEEAAIRAGLKAGKDVIADSTHIKHAFIKRIWAIGEEFGADIEIKEFPISLAEALERNAKRDRQVPPEVIKKMDQALRSSGPFVPEVKPSRQKYKPIEGSVPAVLCDIDGCLALKSNERGYYDWAKVDLDSAQKHVVETLRALAAQGYYVIVMSGRDGVCFDITRDWLTLNDIPCDTLLMRAVGDARADEIVKSELFDAHIREDYDVLLVIDDRPRVARMWRSLGLNVLQVGDPHIEF
jgi:predicted kinase